MYLTTKQASDKLGKSERTIYAWLKVGKLQGEKIDGKWQILASSVESISQNPLAVKQELAVSKQPIEATNREHIESLNQVFSELDTISKVMRDVQTSILVGEQKAQESKKRDIEILTRVVKNQLKLKHENAELHKQNLFLQASFRKLTAQLEQIKAENSALKQLKFSNQKANIQAGNDQELQSKGKHIKNEENAEKWVRNNIPEWFTKPCGFGQLAKHSFEDIALNKAPKANIKGKEMPSRAYLHVLAKKEHSWRKFKAIVALEITEGKKEMYSKAYNHYAHPYEAGG